MHISNVSGHFNATYVIECALKSLDSQAQVRSINAFNYINPKSEKIIDAIYMGVIKKMPVIWRLLYDKPNVVAFINRFKAKHHYKSAQKIKRLYDEFKPDVILCSQAYPCGVVADFKRIYDIDVQLIGVVTDYVPHSFWVYPDVDYYIVASDQAKERLIQKGVPSDRIKCFGIPIEYKFCNNLDRDSIFKKLEFDSRKPVILVMGGGQGLGPIKKIIRLLDRLALDAQLIIVCGTNEKLFRWFTARKDKFNKKIACFKYVDNIDELMQISSVIITKPGGLTTAEAMAKGLPMIIVRPIPGQEENNTQFLLNNNAAIQVNSLKELSPLMESLFTNQDRLDLIRQSANKLGQPEASVNIARLVLDLCNNGTK